MSITLATCVQALRVFLEADGNLRSNPQWRCLKPRVLTPIQATNRLVRTLVGVRKTAPTPSEVVQPAMAGRDIYRALHENVQQLRGSFKHSPLSGEVRGHCLLVGWCTVNSSTTYLPTWFKWLPQAPGLSTLGWLPGWFADADVV